MKSFSTLLLAWVLVMCSASIIMNPDEARTENRTWLDADEAVDLGAATGCGRIGDYVWFDVDRDGIQDTDEAGINGVNVILEGPGGMQTTTTFTGGPLHLPGHYGFDRLSAGEYTIRVDAATVPEGYVVTKVRVAGSTSQNDADCPVSTTVVLATDYSEDFTIDFGYTTPDTPYSGSIGDYVWFDNDRDGLQDQQEQGINGVEVWLYDGVEVRSVTTVTGGSPARPGYYAFEGLCAGSYVISVNAATVPGGYRLTVAHAPDGTPENDSDLPEGTVVALPADDSRNGTIDFGYVAPCTGRIGDHVWHDADQDGIQDDGEKGINGVEVRLVDAVGIVTSARTFTGGPSGRAGYYVFEGLCAGSYGVLVNPATLPQGYQPAPIVAPGGTPGNDSDDPEGTPVLLLDDKSSNLAVDFGYVLECAGCEGGVTRLTLRYLGASDATVVVYEGRKQESGKKLVEDTIRPGGEFTFTGVRPDLTMVPEISIYVNGDLNTAIHTSCSQPIGPGLVRGDFKVIDGYSKDGGRLCPMP